MSRNVLVGVGDPEVAALIRRTLVAHFKSRRCVPDPRAADTAIVDHLYDPALLDSVHDVLILYPKGEKCADPRARPYLTPLQAESFAYDFLLRIGDTFDGAPHARVP